ncbi:hypothetical protein EAF00_009410 [Botryotinia globosa]|nr:hypothetical protein EAF00_009410 [Botryotinia globosa]
MSIVEIVIPTRDVHNPLPGKWVVTDFDHGGSILGIDCLNKRRLQDDDPRVLMSRASANGIECASIGEVMTEQNQDNSNQIGDDRGVGDDSDGVEDRTIGDMTAEHIVVFLNEDREKEAMNTSNDIADRISEDGEEVINESNVPEDGIIENSEESDHESENENNSLESPFPALENSGGKQIPPFADIPRIY